jgi:hypothetical protein
MTIIVTLAAVIVAVAAAARSTWSPCGVSMLSSITPIGERARGTSYRSTAAWFVLGATVGGATLGVAMAGLAGVTRSVDLSPTTVGLLALSAALIAAASDAGIAGFRLPIHGRQVNERWLDQYRPWVYGAGFGWQIGTGLATYITTAAVYLVVVLGAMTAHPATALAVGTGFGILRGLAVLLTLHVTDPSALRLFHRRFHLAGPWVSRVVVVVEAGVAVAVVCYLRSPAAVAVVGVAVCAAVVSAVIAKRRGRVSAPTCPLPASSPVPGTLARDAAMLDSSGSGSPVDPVDPVDLVDLVGHGALNRLD